jgi:aminopeptidase N
VAKNVIDFAWVADPEFVHETAQVPDGPEVHFFYQPGDRTTENWKKLIDYTVKHFQFMNKTFGKYPYEVYSVIQGGDGGMEYPMCTLITGERNLNSLVGVMAHEVAHSWYQAVLASNESLYAWFDEGFTDFASTESMMAMMGGKSDHTGSYNGYFALVRSGLQEPMSQHSDHFSTNRAYGTSAYNMGAVFLHQLKYIIGEEFFYKGMRRYYNTWKFRHPEPIDFIRVMEKTSGLELKWYLRYWVNTTKHIDYSIKNIVGDTKSTNVILERIGEFPMPIDLEVTYTDGTRELYYIPLNETLGNKPSEGKTVNRFELTTWNWVNPSYQVNINKPVQQIKSIEIDPSMRMADVDRKNNIISVAEIFQADSSSK